MKKLKDEIDAQVDRTAHELLTLLRLVVQVKGAVSRVLERKSSRGLQKHLRLIVSHVVKKPE